MTVESQPAGGEPEKVRGTPGTEARQTRKPPGRRGAWGKGPAVCRDTCVPAPGAERERGRGWSDWGGTLGMWKAERI